jgi:NADH-quinone oxidoreductase subunit I
MSALGSYIRNIYEGVSTAFTGMRITMKYLKSPAITLQYPKERMVMFERFRGLLHNRIEDCIGCGQCVRACPVDCITMVIQKAGKDEDLGLTRDGTPKKLHVYQFDIDTLKCMWCNLCTEVCPTECLLMTGQYEVSSYQRDGWTLRFAIEDAPPGFDMEDARLKQNRITNPVAYAGAADPQSLVIPEGSDRPISGAAEFDWRNHRTAALAKAAKPHGAAAAKPAPAPKPDAGAPAEKPAAAPAATPEAGAPAEKPVAESPDGGGA